MSNSSESIGQVLHPQSTLPATRPSPRDLLDSGARDWSVSHGIMIAILLAPLAVAASGVVAALMGKDAYKWLTEEDQIAESLQVGLCVAATIMCLFVVRYQIQAKRPGIALLYVVLCCGLLFLVGEEVSWGQRVFGWATPAAMVELNKQEETNLHNIHGVGHTFKWVQLLVGAYGTILPLVALRLGRESRFRELIEAVIPHWTLVPFFLPMFVWKLYRNLGSTPERFYYVITNYNEVIELILAMGFCLFLVFQLRKCRRDTEFRNALQ